MEATSLRRSLLLIAVIAAMTGCEGGRGPQSIFKGPGPSIQDVMPDEGTTGVAYSLSFSASQGQFPYTWSVDNFPQGLGLAFDADHAEVSGTPQVSGDYKFTVKVEDDNLATDQKTVTIHVFDPLVITTSLIPDGTRGEFYEAHLMATGGHSPISWQVVASSECPVPLTADGDLVGFPLPGMFDCIVEARDSEADSQGPRATQKELTPTIYNLGPSITLLNPANKAAGSGAFDLLVTGDNFFPDSVVRWSGIDRDTTWLGSTQLKAHILADDIFQEGVIQISVFNPPPGGGTATASFTTTLALLPRGVLERVSLASVDSVGDSAQANDRSGTGIIPETSPPAINADGRFVAFASWATNLVDEDGDGDYTNDDTNGTLDCFVRDRATEETIRVSLGEDAGGATIQSHSPCVGVAISATGRYVAFSTASALVPADTNGVSDVYVRDTCLGALGCKPRSSLVSVGISDVDGTKIPGDNDSGSLGLTNQGLSISADGRFVAFWSQAQDLVDGAPVFGAYLHDRDADGDGAFDQEVPGGLETILVSVDNAGAAAAGFVYAPTVSGDGRFVAFVTQANLGLGTTNGRVHNYVRDTCHGTLAGTCSPSTILISKDDSGNEADAGSVQEFPQWISPDGRFLVFRSGATNIGGTTASGGTRIYLHDRDTDDNDAFDEAGSFTTVLVSQLTDGTQIDNVATRAPTVSGDGRFVAFDSTANFDPSVATNVSQIYLRDTCQGPNVPVGCTKRTDRISALSDGTQAPGNQQSYSPAMSVDGRYVALLSDATNFLPPGVDSNAVKDVYLGTTGFTPSVDPLLINSEKPGGVDAGAAEFVIIVRGSGFSPDSVVNWGASPRTTIFVHPGKLLARIRSDDVKDAGKVSISVSSGGNISNLSDFTVN